MKKVALVTGAGSGIGRLSALALLRSGYLVVICGRQEGALRQTIALAANNNNDLIPIRCDVSDPNSVEEMFGEIESRFGRLNVLFNNAGTNMPSTNFGDITYDNWNRIINTNLTGAFLCARYAFDLMRSQNPMGGRIINNGSISAHAPRPGSAPYTASKHAISGLTKTISLDGRAFNISCSQIDIGNALTPLTERMTKGVMQPNGKSAVEPTMNANTVADAVVSIANLPLGTNILSMTIMATNMPFTGRG